MQGEIHPSPSFLMILLVTALSRTCKTFFHIKFEFDCSARLNYLVKEQLLVYALPVNCLLNLIWVILRFAPSPDPSLTMKFYERTPEQQASLGYLVDTSQTGEAVDGESLSTAVGLDNVQTEPHGSVGARAGRRAIAQGNSMEMAEALFRYSAPEEVHILRRELMRGKSIVLELLYFIVGINFVVLN